MYQDGRAAVKYALTTLAIPPGRVILYGESIGTGVAMQMAVDYPVGGVVLQSPYTSLEAIGEGRYPWLPVSLLLEDRFDSLSKVKRLHAPLLLMHGEADTVVPVAEGKTLFAAAPEPKQAHYFPGQGHNDLDKAAMAHDVAAFARKYVR